MPSVLATHKLPAQATKEYPKFLTVKQASEVLNIKESYLRHFMRAKTGPQYQKWGRLIRIPYSALMKWAEEDHRSVPKYRKICP